MSFFAMYPPIFRERKRAALNLASLDELAGLLDRGGFFVGIHPEGTRKKDDDPYTFLPAQSGVGRVIRKARVPVLPVFVNGLLNDLVTQVKGGVLGNGPPIHVVFGQPIDFGGLLDAPESPATYKRSPSGAWTSSARWARRKRRCEPPVDAGRKPDETGRVKQYLDLVRDVLEHGTRKPNRTGVDTLSTFNHNYEIDLRQGFPLLTTKEISWKNIVVENLWFLSGETHIGLLKKHGCKFWDPWADDAGKVPSAYGNFWRHFPVHDGEGRASFNDQVAWVAEELKRNPMSRRLVVTAWAPGNAQTVEAAAVPPAVRRSTCSSTPAAIRMLCLHLTQRSADVALGVPVQHRRLRALARAVLAHHRHPPGPVRPHHDRRSRLHGQGRRLDGRVRPRAGPAHAAHARAAAPAPPRHRSGHQVARRPEARCCRPTPRR